MASHLPLEAAMNVFIDGFRFTRSLTHPYERASYGKVTVLRDAPRTSGDYRTEEYVALSVPAKEIADLAISLKPHRFAVALVHGVNEDAGEVKRDFKANGFQLLRQEPLFLCSKLPAKGPSPFAIRRVLDQADADAVAKVADGKRRIISEHLRPDAPLRLYAGFSGDTPIGWVRSIHAGPKATWVSNLHVVPEYRRKGLGSALMTHMLDDDRRHGVEHSVLTSSKDGSHLYPKVGYKQVGLLHLYVPGANLKPQVYGRGHSDK